MRFLCLHGMGTIRPFSRHKLVRLCNSKILIRSQSHSVPPCPFPLPSCESLTSAIWQAIKSKSATNLGRPLSSFFWMGRLIANVLQVCFSLPVSIPDMLSHRAIPSFLLLFILFLIAVYIPSSITIPCSGCKPSLMNQYVSLTMILLRRYLQYLPRSVPMLSSLSPVCGRYCGGPGAGPEHDRGRRAIRWSPWIFTGRRARSKCYYAAKHRW